MLVRVARRRLMQGRLGPVKMVKRLVCVCVCVCEGGETQIKWKLKELRVGIECYLLFSEQR